IDENDSKHLDKVILSLNGEDRMCEINIYPLQCEDETQNNETNNRGAVIRIDDITERNKLEEIMIQSDKMLTVGGLAAGMAHEINTPLGSIIQSTQVLNNRLDKNNNKNQRVAEDCELDIENLDQYLHRRGIFQLLAGIGDGGSRTSKIVKSMLSFSHQGSASTVHQINEIIDEALELAKSDYDLKKRYHFMNFTIIKNYADGIPSIKFDRTKLEQVILNLVKNAAHAMLDMPNGHKPCIEITTAVDTANLLIKIKDNGPGISDEIQKRIFDPFFTTKEVGSGTGLGLSLAYFIINRQHNGIIQVQSTPGNGAEFSMSLPLDAHPSAQQAP
ncbi:MAG: hypothetical protein HQL46_14885, partial [Gammaproteobacteria bacterium]|nr:hypothetical protein [Gammaproteobacteria bacterium]